MHKQLKALEPLICGRREYQPGDEFEASEEDAHTLLTLGKVATVSVDEAQEQAGKKRRYMRRDMSADQ